MTTLAIAASDLDASPTDVSAPRTITVYREVGDTTELCNMGCPHQVYYVEVKRLAATGEERLYNDGYTTTPTPLFVDTQGRIYHAHPPTDYSGGTYYVRDGDAHHFLSRTLRSTHLYRDLFGKAIGPNSTDGPAWSESIRTPVKARR